MNINKFEMVLKKVEERVKETGVDITIDSFDMNDEKIFFLGSKQGYYVPVYAEYYLMDNTLEFFSPLDKAGKIIKIYDN